MELYSKSFPIYEQRLHERQKKIMTEPEYNFLLIFDGDIWIGELLCWETEDFIYVEHIHPPYHSEYKGHRLVVMICPTAISENEYKNFNSYLENVVMKK